MENIKKFEQFNVLNESEYEKAQGDEITVGKLIDMLSKFDPQYPVRMSFQGYHNQEIIDVVEGEEYEGNHDNSYPIVSINAR